MKVLHIIAAYKPAAIYGGPTMSTAMLCEELSAAGISIDVYATTANGDDELQVNTGIPQDVDGVRVTYFKRITKDHTHFSPGLLKKLWKTVKNYDVVHIHAWWNTVSVLSCMIALSRNVPVVVSPRGTLSPYSFTNRNIGAKKMIHSLFGRPFLNKSHIHTTSVRETEAMLKLIRPKSVTVIANFVKLNDVSRAKKQTVSSPFKLLFLSRIEEKKGLDILLNALQNIPVTYHLTIAGTGQQSYVDQLKEQSAGFAQNITWAGFASGEKFEMMQAHDLLVLPSHDENFGNVVIESLSVGTAVLVSKQVGLADYVGENKLGWVCDTDVQAVTDFLIDIINNRSEDMIRIRSAAPPLVRRDFTGVELVNKYIGLYRQIIKA